MHSMPYLSCTGLFTIYLVQCIECIRCSDGVYVVALQNCATTNFFPVATRLYCSHVVAPKVLLKALLCCNPNYVALLVLHGAHFLCYDVLL